MDARLIFAHGLEGSPEGRKVTAMKAAGLSIDAPDFQGMILQDRVDLLDRVTTAHVAGGGGPIVLGGSSYGGLAAAWLAQQHAGRFAALLLLAPALGHNEAPSLFPDELVAPRTLPTVIVHGRFDKVVPLAGSFQYADRSGKHVRLVQVDDDHSLAQSMDVILAVVRSLLAAV